MKRISVRFYKAELSKEPVREWLLDLKPMDKQAIGIDIKTVEYCWPIGMPLVRKLETNLWEVRSNISNRRIARILFTLFGANMVLLHGFIKKSKATPKSDLNLARKRCKNVLNQW